MWRRYLALTACCTCVASANLVGQSTLLIALEGAPPPPVLEPSAAALTKGVASIWVDPTVEPKTTGAFFAMQHASYASLYVFHSTIAFRLGPRWSLSYASVALGTLFDSSLIRQDPSLASLRAQAHWGQLDATFGSRRLVASVGLAIVGDENVGVFESSTLARVHLRIAPLTSRDVTIGVQASRYIGGSVPGQAQGRQSLDLTVTRPLGNAVVSVAAAASRGALWRYSETDRGYGLAAQVTALSVFDIGGSLGWYSTTYGASRSEVHKSIGAAIRIGRIHLGTRYASTRLGVGSSLGFSLGYGATPAR